MAHSPDRLCSTVVLVSDDCSEAGPGDPCEVVVLQSVRSSGGFEATAVRSWVSALDGSGLEADTTDPVTILTGTGDDLERFHHRALAELHRRRHFDFEVADLFAAQLP